MRLIHTVADLRAALRGEHETAFVPTMGNLHAGHVALAEQAKQAGGPVVASIFVNPLQFGAGEDFDNYPRTLDADCEKLAAVGTDIVFAPKASEVYPEPQSYLIKPPLADELCGAHRPGHFEGVATVVLKLFNMVQPRYAVFGKKDYQQLFILKGLVRQFNLPIEILEGETVRAEDGLALSSRNGYLSAKARQEAPRLYTTLQMVSAQLKDGRTDFAQIEAEAVAELNRHGWVVDYVAIRSQSSLLAPQAGETRIAVLAAAKLDSTRLIDNLEVGLGPT